ncbi:unnamed protein product [Penicillium salamii]|nr:unnamed protein product [Penicillium salamii]CAG8243068.1 unnamed protein product [Penicillium salamii]
MSKAFLDLVGKRLRSYTGKNDFSAEDTHPKGEQASRFGCTVENQIPTCRKAIPSGLSENDTEVLTKVKRRAYQLDYALFELCGIHFGWGSVIGLVPLIGDASDTALAIMVVRSCGEIDGGLPADLRLKMMSNVILDLVIGLCPLVGDLADAIYKANIRNAHILETYLCGKDAEGASKQSKQLEQSAEVDHSLSDAFVRQGRKDVGDNPLACKDVRLSSLGVIHNADPEASTRTEPAQNSRRDHSFCKWLGGSDNPEEDLERGKQ